MRSMILWFFVLGLAFSPWFLGFGIQFLIYLRNTKRLIHIIKKMVEKLMVKKEGFVYDDCSSELGEVEVHRHEIIRLQGKFEDIMYEVSETKVIRRLLNKRLRKLAFLIQEAHNLLDIHSGNHIRLSHFGSIKGKEPSWMTSF